MKFIDELDIERINQTLSFETNDCKITGGCDIFTTKPVASDKKLYKTIDHHLETLLQENESYKAAVHQQILMEANNNHNNSNTDDNNSNTESPSPFYQTSKDKNSFWEQKRRMSVTEHNNNNNGNGNDNQDNPYANLNPTFINTSKLNDQNLKELMTNSEIGARGSSSNDPKDKLRRSSSSSSMQSSKSQNFKRRRSSLNDTNSNITIGPFGPIKEPASRRTFAYLIAILNASYPDHDFSSLEPTDFVKSSLKSFISKFENSLYSWGKQSEDWMWEIVNSHMTLSGCVVYLYSPAKSFLEDEPGYLWSLMGFLFNKKRKRVAFLYLISSRLKGPSTDIAYEDNFAVNPKRKLTIDDGSNQFEGEYDLINDEEAIADDTDDDFLIGTRI